jgi:hypothetical protein
MNGAGRWPAAERSKVMSRTFASAVTIGLALTIGAVAVARATSGATIPEPVTLLDTPALDGSGMYALSNGADGRTYLSWIDVAEDKTASLRFARLENGRWGAPRTVASGRDWFVNWADHPSVTAAADGSLFAHWLVNNPGSSGYGYGIRIARSADAGRTWTEIFKEGTTHKSDYAGFVTLLPQGTGVTAVYLTPTPAPAHPAGAGEGHEAPHVKTFAVAQFGQGGTLVSNQAIDGDVCTCCSTSVVPTADGLVAAYRDHNGPVRDISVVRLAKGKWTEPARVHADNWLIDGCPTNGPALAASGRRTAIAWFTAAGEVPRVRLASSIDGGASFASPVVIDGGKPVGWPGLVMLDDGSVVVSWLESTGNGNGEVRLRRVSADGRLGDSQLVAAAKGGRLTGIPKIVRVGDALMVAWRDGRVKTALVATPR